MTDQPGAPADAVSAEDTLYLSVVSEFRGIRRAGAGLVEAAVLTMAHLTIVNAAGEQ